MKSTRFLIRSLMEVDVSDTYVSWFLDNTVREFIKAAQVTQTIDSLKSHVRQNLGNPHSFLVGIFTLGTSQHIGNIKFDYIDVEKRLAFVGILIGDPVWRGKGVFKEVFKLASQHLFSVLGIKDFWLGVLQENANAIKAYKKTGFQGAVPPPLPIPCPNKTGFYMHYVLEN